MKWFAVSVIWIAVGLCGLGGLGDATVGVAVFAAFATLIVATN